MSQETVIPSLLWPSLDGQGDLEEDALDTDMITLTLRLAVSYLSISLSMFPSSLAEEA